MRTQTTSIEELKESIERPKIRCMSTSFGRTWWHRMRSRFGQLGPPRLSGFSGSARNTLGPPGEFNERCGGRQGRSSGSKGRQQSKHHNCQMPSESRMITPVPSSQRSQRCKNDPTIDAARQPILDFISRKCDMSRRCLPGRSTNS